MSGHYQIKGLLTDGCSANNTTEVKKVQLHFRFLVVQCFGSLVLLMKPFRLQLSFSFKELKNILFNSSPVAPPPPPPATSLVHPAAGTSGSTSTDRNSIPSRPDLSSVRIAEVGGALSNDPMSSGEPPSPADHRIMVNNSPPALFFWGQGETSLTENRRRRNGCCRHLSIPSHCQIL